MVTTRSTIEGVLKELEDQLPIEDAFPRPLLNAFSREVIPTINLADYDPDSNTGSSGSAQTNYGQFGQLIALEAGTATLTSVGAQTHTYILDTGGVPAGEVHVYTAMSMFCDAAAAEDFSCFINGFGIGALSLLAGTFRVPAGATGQTSLIGNSGSPTSPAVNDAALFQNPFVMHPGSTLTIGSLTTLVGGAVTRIDMIRERYLTNQVMADRSADIGAILV